MWFSVHVGNNLWQGHVIESWSRMLDLEDAVRRRLRPEA